MPRIPELSYLLYDLVLVNILVHRMCRQRAADLGTVVRWTVARVFSGAEGIDRNGHFHRRSWR